MFFVTEYHRDDLRRMSGKERIFSILIIKKSKLELMWTSISRNFTLTNYKFLPILIEL